MSSPAPNAPRRSRVKQVAATAAMLLITYVIVAYVALPLAWERYVRRRPNLENMPRITHTSAGIPGDPLNVSLTGTETEMKRAMKAAGWLPADPLSLRSRLEIAEATVLERNYEDAPVSNLYWDGRKEDLAFEQPVGHNPRQRHHVRFWDAGLKDLDGRPIWVGSATFDDRVGFSHTTGQITHHIEANIDAERDHLFKDLETANQLVNTTVQPDFQQQREGRNGGGDPWHTDGSLYRGIIRPTFQD